jgi:hypothetical protein
MTVVENAKELTGLIQKLGDIDLYRKTVELEGEIVELSRQKSQLEQRVDELEKSRNLRTAMTFKPPLYFHEGDDIPFCPQCYERDGRALHLACYNREPSKKVGESIHWVCRSCREDYLVVNR